MSEYPFSNDTLHQPGFCWSYEEFKPQPKIYDQGNTNYAWIYAPVHGMELMVMRDCYDEIARQNREVFMHSLYKQGYQNLDSILERLEAKRYET